MRTFPIRRSGTAIAALALALPLATVAPATAEPGATDSPVATVEGNTCSHTITASEKGMLSLSYLPMMTTMMIKEGKPESVAERTTHPEGFAMKQELKEKSVTVKGETTVIRYDGALRFTRKKVNRITEASITNLRAELKHTDQGTAIDVYGDTVEQSRNSDEVSNGLGHENPGHELGAMKEDVFLFGTTEESPIGSDQDTTGVADFRSDKEITRWGDLPEPSNEDLRGDGGQYPARLMLNGQVKTDCAENGAGQTNGGSAQSWLDGKGPSILGIGSLSALMAFLSSLPFLVPMIARMLPSLLQGQLPK